MVAVLDSMTATTLVALGLVVASSGTAWVWLSRSDREKVTV